MIEGTEYLFTTPVTRSVFIVLTLKIDKFPAALKFKVIKAGGNIISPVKLNIDFFILKNKLNANVSLLIKRRIRDKERTEV